MQQPASHISQGTSYDSASANDLAKLRISSGPNIIYNSPNGPANEEKSRAKETVNPFMGKNAAVSQR